MKSLGEAAITVFGNHDFHLLCVAEGAEPRKKRDTIDEVLDAPDRDELLEWLRHRPLLHVEDGFALVHAGLLPQWSISHALSLAGEVQAAMRGPRYRELLANMYGDKPRRWRDELEGFDRLRVVINAMTRLRVVDGEGQMVLSFKGEPGETHEGLTPWFDFPRRASGDHAVICGHWSALGLLVRADVACLDSGCVWGGSLSAIRLSDRSVFSVQCPPARGREG